MTFESAWWSVLFRVLAGVLLRAQSSRYMALTRPAVAIAATAAVFAVLHALQARSPTSHPCSRRHMYKSNIAFRLNNAFQLQSNPRRHDERFRG